MADKMRKIMIAMLVLAGVGFLYLAYREYKPFEEVKIELRALSEAVTEEDGMNDPIDRNIDFDALKEMNPDIIGWLYAPQIGVDQPILHGERYLKKDFAGNYSALGSVFTYDYADELLTDEHICLFAHNMRSGQMFGNLKKFRDSAFVEENSSIYLYTPERAKELKVYEVKRCHKSDAVFQWEWQSGYDRQTFTLATCSGYTGTAYRLVVNVEVVREKVVF